MTFTRGIKVQKGGKRPGPRLAVPPAPRPRVACRRAARSRAPAQRPPRRVAPHLVGHAEHRRKRRGRQTAACANLFTLLASGFFSPVPEQLLCMCDALTAPGQPPRAASAGASACLGSFLSRRAAERSDVNNELLNEFREFCEW